MRFIITDVGIAAAIAAGLGGPKVDIGKFALGSGRITTNLGTGDGIQTVFGGTLTELPVKRGLVTVAFGTPTGEVFTDDGNGLMIGNDGGTGTINYDTGAISVTFTAPVPNLAPVDAVHYYGGRSTITGEATGQTSTGVVQTLGASTTYSKVVPGSLILRIGVTTIGIDNGLGGITGPNITAGAINYDTGAWSATFDGSQPAGAILADYIYETFAFRTALVTQHNPPGLVDISTITAINLNTVQYDCIADQMIGDFPVNEVGLFLEGTNDLFAYAITDTTINKKAQDLPNGVLGNRLTVRAQLTFSNLPALVDFTVISGAGLASQWLEDPKVAQTVNELLPVEVVNSYQYSEQLSGAIGIVNRTIPFPDGCSGSNRVLLVSFHSSTRLDVSGTPTYDGANLTLVEARDTGGTTVSDLRTKVYYMIAPATGTKDLAISINKAFTGDINFSVKFMALANAAQTAMPAAANGDANVASNPAQVLVNVATSGSFIADFLTNGFDGFEPTALQVLLLRSTFGVGNIKTFSAAYFIPPSTGNHIMSWANPSARYWAQSTLVIAPAGVLVLAPNKFTLPGVNLTQSFHAGRRVKINQSVIRYANIADSVVSGPDTLVTVDDAVIDNTLATVDLALLTGREPDYAIPERAVRDVWIGKWYKAQALSYNSFRILGVDLTEVFDPGLAIRLRSGSAGQISYNWVKSRTFSGGNTDVVCHVANVSLFLTQVDVSAIRQLRSTVGQPDTLPHDLVSSRIVLANSEVLAEPILLINRNGTSDPNSLAWTTVNLAAQFPQRQPRIILLKYEVRLQGFQDMSISDSYLQFRRTDSSPINPPGRFFELDSGLTNFNFNWTDILMLHLDNAPNPPSFDYQYGFDMSDFDNGSDTLKIWLYGWIY